MLDKSGSFCFSSIASITELSDWHIKIIHLAFDDNPHKFYEYCINELDDVTPYEALILVDKLFPEPQEATFWFLNDDGEVEWNSMRELQRMPHMQEMVAPKYKGKFY